MRFLLLLFTVLISACSISKSSDVESNQDKPVPYITFDKQKVVLGEIKKGEERTLEYNFTNTGNADLIIELVTACKCASIEWTRGTIPPNGQGSLSVVFDSKNQNLGVFTKTIDIISNTDPIVEECFFEGVIVD